MILYKICLCFAFVFVLFLIVFRKPGLYRVQVDVEGAFEKTFTSRQMINVEQEIDSWQTCPEYVVRGEVFECQITVRKGSNMTLSVDSFPGK